MLVGLKWTESRPNSIDGTLMPWLDTLWSTLLQHFPLPPHLHILPSDARPPPRISLTPVPIPSTSTSLPFITPSGMMQATLKQNKRVTAQDHFQDTRHIILEFEEDLNYEAGDILEVRPENLSEDVDQFLKVMKWQDQADQVFDIRGVTKGELASIITFSHTATDISVKERPLPSHWPRQTTLRQLFTHYLDVFAVPRRSFFEWLSYFTSAELETEKLQEFCSAEGQVSTDCSATFRWRYSNTFDVHQDDMYSYANRPRRTIAEVLTEFKSAVIPLEYITDLFPEIRPRQFSIASSAKVSLDLCRHVMRGGLVDSASRQKNPRTVELLVAIVKYKTILKLPRRGIATSWLAQLQPGQKLSVGFASGSMRLPADLSTPVVVVGPGTGIAPFRAFVQERLSQQEDISRGALANGHSSLVDRNGILVFFGCRSRQSDYYFQEEWENLHESKQITFDLAASRDQEDKVYVQHRILEQSKLLWDYLGLKNGVLYISG